MKNEERKKMELWARAQKELAQNPNLEKDFGILAFDVLQKIGSTPVIQVDKKGKIVDYKNIDWIPNLDRDSIVLYSKLEGFKNENNPIKVIYKDIINQTLYYGDTPLLKKLKIYPIALLLIIFIFAFLLIFLFQTNKYSEQNKLWVGMAKETAHQISTPLTSLMGWIEILKEKKIKKNSILEIEKDIKRLELIAERFSKIGASPKLKNENIIDLISKTLEYLRKRSGNKVIWKWNPPKKPLSIPMNSTLISWTIENIAKNGIDSIKGEGELKIELINLKNIVRILISDNGVGIQENAVNKIFNPGYTTKKSGWGLGLSLVERIIVNFHKGRVTVKETKVGKGTTFEISLNKKLNH
ncbi:MAG: two-component sensor histidine kinase [Flavobacteriaceae bacterium]|nr:two-component sensor histidine kinase [Flavobacteriaceae bacterium]|tara:strand:+ start:1825 stop:2889 length:1065 start_codon:yes stop_codon:yes gene_type:complete